MVAICDTGYKIGCDVNSNDCPPGQKCCFNGCSYTCYKPGKDLKPFNYNWKYHDQKTMGNWTLQEKANSTEHKR